jgi:hypothetical protein
VFNETKHNKTGLTLRLDGNQVLEGCLPLKPNMYAVAPSYIRTGIVGMCDTNATALEVQQKDALRNYLPKLLFGVDWTGDGVKSMVQNMVQWTSWFGSVVDDRENSTILMEKQRVDATLVRTLQLGISVEDGVEYVTSIYVSSGLADPVCHKAPLEDRGIGLNLTALPWLASNLSRLRHFECISCNGNANASEMQLPANMSIAAQNMMRLVLPQCGVTGWLPLAWGRWESLQTLELSYNNLQGTLPAEWGDGTMMQSNIYVGLMCNPGLNGTVPSTWSHFAAGVVVLNGTSIGGCAPDLRGLQLRHDMAMPSCWTASPEAVALQALKASLIHASIKSSPALDTWINGKHYA